MGTVGYMSPEQGERPERRLPLRPVLPGLGAVRDGDGPAGVQAGHGGGRRSRPSSVRTRRRSPRSTRPRPPPLAWVVERCLAKDPEERYASTRDLAREAAQRPGPPLGQHARPGGTPAGAALAARGDRFSARAGRPGDRGLGGALPSRWDAGDGDHGDAPQASRRGCLRESHRRCRAGPGRRHARGRATQGLGQIGLVEVVPAGTPPTPSSRAPTTSRERGSSSPPR